MKTAVKYNKMGFNEALIYCCTLNIISLLAVFTAFPANAQAPLITPIQAAASGNNAPAATLAAPGTPFHELIPGDGGGRYVLTHGNIVPGSVIVTENGQALLLNNQYWLDTASGSLSLAKPASQGELISVTYRYLEGAAASSSLLSTPGIALNLGQNTKMGLLFGLTSNNGAGANTTLNGLSFNSKFGEGGLSNFNGLAYFSNVQASRNITFDPSSQKKTPSTAFGSDRLLLQNLQLHKGGLNFTGLFQDIGSKFSGFTALKQGADTAMQQQLTTLEQEKGIRRLGFGLDFSNPIKGAQPATGNGFALNWNTIQDGKGSIANRSAAFRSGVLNLNYNAQDIGANFTQFNNLREADKAQWARAKGLKSQTIGLGMQFGSGKNAAAAGGLSIDQMSFGDKSGALKRNLYNLKTRGMDVSVYQSIAGSKFNRLGDLMDTDKSMLALDTYKLYNPDATASAVTPADMAQMPLASALQRSGLNFSLQPSKTGSIQFSQMQTSETIAGAQSAAAPAMSREALDLHAGLFNFSLLSRSSDPSFHRFATLPDIDKKYLALDILKEVNPQAQINQVTPIEMNQAALSEAGLHRTLLDASLLPQKPNKGGTISVSQLSITDLSQHLNSGEAAPSLQRQMINYLAKNLQVGITRQSISSTFTRLSSLSDMEKSQFGNEYGLSQTQMNLGWQLNKATHFAMSTLNVTPTQDESNSLIQQASKQSLPLSTAQQIASAGLQQNSLSLTGQGMNVTLATSKVSKDFTRSFDIPVAILEQRALDALRGFQTTALTFQYNRIKGLTLDNYSSNSVDSIDHLFHNIVKRNFTFTPSKTLAMNYSADEDVASASGLGNGYRHNLFTLSEIMNKNNSLKVAQESRTDLAAGHNAQTINHETIHLDAAQLGKGGMLDYQVQQSTSLDGIFADFSTLQVQTKPANDFTLNYTRSDVQQSPNPNIAADKNQKQISSATQGVNVQYQATKQFSVQVASSTTNSTDYQDAHTMTLGMQGQPLKDITLAAQFNETHTVADHITHDDANVSISNVKPISFGPVKNLIIKAGYVSLNNSPTLHNESMTGHAEWSLWKNSFLLDYSGEKLPTGMTTITRLYSFDSDNNPKLWIHGAFYYRDWTLITGQTEITRRFNIDARLAKTTHLVYTYGTLPDAGKGLLIPETNADVSLEHLFPLGLKGRIFYQLSDNTATRLLTRSLGLGMEGSIGKNETLSVNLLKGVNGFINSYDRSNQVQFAFNRHINANEFFTISTSWLSHHGIGPTGKLLSNEIRSDLSFNYIF